MRDSKILTESETKYKPNYNVQNQRDSDSIELSNSKYSRYSRKFIIEDKSNSKAE